MIVHMKPGITTADKKVQAVMQKAASYGLKPESHVETGSTSNVLEIYLKDGTHKAGALAPHIFENMDGVSAVVRRSVPIVSAYMNGGDNDHRQIQIGSATIGGNNPCLAVAGQCSVDQYIGQTVEVLVGLGYRHIRGCHMKPRSSPDAFRGFGAEGCKMFLEAAKANGVESAWMEIVESCDIDEVRQIRDQVGYEGDIVLWVGARNLGNYRLLQALGKQHEFKVMLKHGLNVVDIEDFINAASFVLHGPMWWNPNGTLDEVRSKPVGNQDLIFCVRGLHKNDRYDKHRFQPNLDWIDEIHERSWAPVCLDPSHTGGHPGLVKKDLRNGLLHNPDVVMIECHIYPYKALTDKDQALNMEEMAAVMQIIRDHNKSNHSVAFAG